MQKAPSATSAPLLKPVRNVEDQDEGEDEEQGRDAAAEEEDEEQVQPNKAFNFTCHMPDAARSADEAGGRRSSGRLASIRVHTLTKFNDVMIPFSSAMDAHNAVAVFVLRVNTSEKDIQEQIGLLKVFTAQHYWTPVHQRAASGVLLILGDSGMGAGRFPPIVEAFSKSYADLRHIRLATDPAGDGRQMLNLAVDLATELGKERPRKDRKEVDASARESSSSGWSRWMSPFRRRSKETHGA
jgi:hypothetical protein